MNAAQMALWARAHDLTRAEIATALYQTRVLVKTSCMRQTLHLIPAADFGLYISALQASRMQALWRIMSRLDIAPKQIERLNEMIVAALASGPMTQPELSAQIMPRLDKKMKAYRQLVWGIQMFRPALVQGLICYGPERNKKATFIRTDHWLPQQKAIAPTEAQRLLLRKYLRAYGPATLQDFSRWSGMTKAEARVAHALLREELMEVRCEDQKKILLRADYEQLAHSALHDPVLCLLPGFDPYLLGHADKGHLVDPIHYKRVYRNQGWISPVVLVDGKVRGVWAWQLRGARLRLRIEPFEKFSKRNQSQLEHKAERLASFLGCNFGNAKLVLQL